MANSGVAWLTDCATQATLRAIVPQLGAFLAEVERQSAADEKALADCIGEAACARKSRWAKFEEDFDQLVGSLREVRVCLVSAVPSGP